MNQSNADKLLSQTMEKNKRTPKVGRQKVLDTLHQIIEEGKSNFNPKRQTSG